MEAHEPHDDATVARPAAAPVPPPVPATAASDDAVAQALQELDSVARRPLTDHPDAFARVHAGLQQALSEIDDT